MTAQFLDLGRIKMGILEYHPISIDKCYILRLGHIIENVKATC